MRPAGGGHPQWDKGFFLTALLHTSLANYYETTWALNFYHKYSITELDEMFPWERDIYLNLVLKYLKEEKLQHQQQHGLS